VSLFRLGHAQFACLPGSRIIVTSTQCADNPSTSARYSALIQERQRGAVFFHELLAHSMVFGGYIVHADGQKTILQFMQELLVGRKIAVVHSPHAST
jgi:hypothetical protein